MGESLAVLGWNIGVSNLRLDADYVLVRRRRRTLAGRRRTRRPEDLRFGLYGALAHPIEANGIGGCRDVTGLDVQPLTAPTPDRLTGHSVFGPAA